MSREPIEFGIAPPLHGSPPEAKKWQWALFVIVVLLGVGGLAFGVHVTNQLRQTYDPIEGTAMQIVDFEVTGTGTASTITATVGTTVQTESNVALPWTRTIQVPPGGLSVKLAVVAGQDGAEVHGKFT